VLQLLKIDEIARTAFQDNVIERLQRDSPIVRTWE
jgi:hypothetical protein